MSFLEPCLQSLVFLSICVRSLHTPVFPHSEYFVLTSAIFSNTQKICNWTIIDWLEECLHSTTQYKTWVSFLVSVILRSAGRYECSTKLPNNRTAPNWRKSTHRRNANECLWLLYGQDCQLFGLWRSIIPMPLLHILLQWESLYM